MSLFPSSKRASTFYLISVYNKIYMRDITDFLIHRLIFVLTILGKLLNGIVNEFGVRRQVDMKTRDQLAIRMFIMSTNSSDKINKRVALAEKWEEEGFR